MARTARLLNRSTVTLSLVDRVEAVLRGSQTAMSRNEVLARLADKGHATSRQRLNVALKHLVDHNVVHDAGRDGVVWLGRPTLQILERLARARVVA